MKREALIGTGSALLFGAVVGGLTYTENMHRAEERNVGFEATDRVVACAEYLGDRALYGDEIKQTCITKSFVREQQNSDGSIQFVVKFPTQTEYLRSFYDSAKFDDAEAKYWASRRALSGAIGYGMAASVIAGAASILIFGARKRDAEQK